MVETIINNFEIWAKAQRIKTKGRGISANNQKLHGICNLRNLILELAVRGKLVPQNPKDKPASELLEMNTKEKTCVTENGNNRQHKQVLEIEEFKRPFEIPKSWEWRHLDECFLIMSGASFDKAKELENGQYLYVKVADMNLEGNEFEITTSSRFYNPTMKELNALIPARSIIFPKRGGAIATNKKRLTNYDLFVDLNIMAITPIKGISLNYAYYWLMGVDLAMLNTGTSVPQINHKDIAPLLFPIPPKAEQQRIVAKVDELMALCDQLEKQQSDSNAAHEILVETLLDTLTNATGQAELESAWQRIANHFETLFNTEHSVDRLKQTILQLAVMGKLVPQNPGDEPVIELLNKIGKEKARLVKEGIIKKQNALPEIKEDEKPFELPTGWEWVRLGIYGNVFSGNSFKSEDFNEIGGTKVIKITNAGVGEVIETEDYLPASFLNEYQQYIVEKDDLILALTRPYISTGLKISKCPPSYNNSLLNQRVSAIRLITDVEYVFIYLRSLFVLNLYKDRFGNSGLQPNLKVSDVTELVLPVPPESEQQRIVAKVDELFGICDALKERIREAQGIQMDLADALVEGALG